MSTSTLTETLTLARGATAGQLAAAAYRAVINGDPAAALFVADAADSYRDTLDPAARDRLDAEYARMGIAGHTGRRQP